MPWKIAHKTDLLTYQEITMARAVPKVMPVLIVSNLYDIFISLTTSICPLFDYKAILCSAQIAQQVLIIGSSQGSILLTFPR
jgi:hypothetical protein